MKKLVFCAESKSGAKSNMFLPLWGDILKLTLHSGKWGQDSWIRF
jgi:hypothetical protein